MAFTEIRLPAGALHEDWNAEWAPSIRGVKNRQALAGDPRLRFRPAGLLSGASATLDIASLDGGDRAVLAAVMADSGRFMRLLGLGTLAPSLARQIDGAALRQLFRHFSPEDVTLALRCLDAVNPVRGSEFDWSRLGQFVPAAGQNQLWLWVESLSQPARAFLRPIFPKYGDFGDGSDQARADAVRLARRFASEIQTVGSNLQERAA